MSKKKKEEQVNYSALKFLWDYLTSQYEFKRDVIKARILWRKKGSKDEFTPLSNEKLNTIVIDCGLAGVKSSSASNIELFLYSEYVEPYNPIEEYLKRVGKKNPKGTIDKLAKCVITTNPELWEKYLKKWLVSSVANVLNKVGCQNHTCLTQVSSGGDGQGKGKSTFFSYLCPSSLSDYMYTGELDLKNRKDTLWKLAEYWFVNIEEQIKDLNRQDANYMKNLITLPDIKGRRPYDRIDSSAYRIANFMASTNDDDFLTDPSGSRRYLCFRILEFKEKEYRKISIDDVWAEAYNLYLNKDYVYYVTAEEIKEVQTANKEFTHVTPEQEYISTYFAKPEKQSEIDALLPATVIRDFLKTETGNYNIKERAIGVALSSYGFEQTSYRFPNSSFPVRVWKLKLIPGKGESNSMLNPFRVPIGGGNEEKKEPAPAVAAKADQGRLFIQSNSNGKK